jgi:hypothetical protein
MYRTGGENQKGRTEIVSQDDINARGSQFTSLKNQALPAATTTRMDRASSSYGCDTHLAWRKISVGLVELDPGCASRRGLVISNY